MMPSCPQVATATVGEIFRVETQDWTGGQIGNNDSAEDMKKVDLTKVHNLSGPIRIVDKARAFIPQHPGCSA